MNAAFLMKYFLTKMCFYKNQRIIFKDFHQTVNKFECRKIILNWENDIVYYQKGQKDQVNNLKTTETSLPFKILEYETSRGFIHLIKHR